MTAISGPTTSAVQACQTGPGHLHCSHEERTPAGAPGVDAATVLIAARRTPARDLLRRQLAAGGYAVFAVPGEHATAMLDRPSPVDLVLIDAGLPSHGALSIVKQVVARGAGRPPVAIFTDTPGDFDAALECMAFGAEDYVPVTAPPPVLLARVGACIERHRLRQTVSDYDQRLVTERQRLTKLLDVVIPLGLGLAAEQDFQRLLERILLESMSLCNADAGTLYLRTSDDHLAFTIMRTASLGVALGGTTGTEIPHPPLALHHPETGAPNDHYIAVHAALAGTTLNIEDAYQVTAFDFSGTRSFDQRTGYRSTSFLVVPLKNVQERVIGVIQLINAQDAATGRVIPFDNGLQRMVESLSALAVVALEAYLRVQGLTERVKALEVEIDRKKAASEVAEITETDYFQRLRSRATDLRSRGRRRES